ncbi:ABC transporter B family member 3, putative [Plasmodium relictum]|uniref:ABC transporter B family member 3, putative n=1 Tax=Plasmodium relictum TaxID=85471 RepID=A0A1J1H5W9_PLARL|nr:ABC transporter B family member 3, putative [Plasmodium relictum]CRH00326.1 ABC transporter B family member 3, putative [Plasmodium relictum]
MPKCLLLLVTLLLLIFHNEFFMKSKIIINSKRNYAIGKFKKKFFFDAQEKIKLSELINKFPYRKKDKHIIKFKKILKYSFINSFNIRHLNMNKNLEKKIVNMIKKKNNKCLIKIGVCFKLDYKNQFLSSYDLCKEKFYIFLKKLKSKTDYYMLMTKKYIEKNNMINFLWICKNILWKKEIFFLTLFVMVNSAIISIIIPKFDNLIFSELTNRKLDNFYYLLCNCIFFRVINISLCSLRNYIFMITSADCLKKVKSILFQIYLNKEYEYYDKVNHNIVINKLTLESHDFSDIIPYYINPFIRNFFSIIFNFSYIFYLNKKLSTVILCCFLFSSFLTMISSKLKKKRIKSINKQKAHNTKVSLEALNNMNIVKLYSTEIHEYSKYSNSLNRILNLQIKKEQFNLFYMILNKLFVTITYILIILQGDILLKNNQIDKKTFTSFFFYINNIYSYIYILDYYIDIHDIVDQYHHIIKLIKKYVIRNRDKLKFNDHTREMDITNKLNIEEIEMNKKEDIKKENRMHSKTNEIDKIDKNNESELKNNDKSEISNLKSFKKEKNIENSLYFKDIKNKENDVILSFKNVFFKYSNNPSSYVLKNINMKIYKNTNNIIIGKSGGGKSTILKLILNLYKCTKGKIYLYNKLLNSYSSREIFEKITYVEQNSKLLKATIKENLIYGMNNKNFDMIDLINVSRCCTSHEFISRLRKRYETVVSNKTELLSSSQKQKICIARALVRYPKILLLDESTSSLGKDNERTIFENIKKNSTFKNLTIIHITHKKANLDLCDNIFILKDGYLTRQKNF